MARRAATTLGGVLEAAGDQDGVVTRRQALAAGFSSDMIQHRLDTGRWQRLSHGVYATFSGPPPRTAQLWAAVLAAGADAVLSHESAAELGGLADAAAAAIHVTVPHGRRIARRPGVIQHVSNRVKAARHPTRRPPQTRVEETVIDLTQSAATLDQAMSWLARACGRRLTTADRLAAAMTDRARLRWRTELAVALLDVAQGCHSLPELRYLRDVERAHGLPTASRQRIRRRRGGRWYDDISYDEYRTIVEIDGSSAHPVEALGRDLRRDNTSVVDGYAVLRYLAAMILASPCAVALEVARVLRRHGWTDRPYPCGRPDCALAGAE